jgi:SAM-dependent methyltransferase
MTDPPNGPYEDAALASAYDVHAADSAYNAHYDRPAVLKLLGEVDGKRILDAGCGPGHYAAELVARGADVVGFDLSHAMLDLARRRLGHRVPLHHAALGDGLPYEDATFDLVVCALAIHHTEDRHAAFAEFHRLLKARGAAVVSTTHPAVDWVRKGGSYFDVKAEVDTFELDGRGAWDIRWWREPLSSLCHAATSAGFVIEKLCEPRPSAIIRERWPARFEKLQRQPDFLVLRLLKL